MSFASWHDVVNHERLLVLCDLDGTLIPFAETATDATLDTPTGELLRSFAAVGAQVVIVSGRPRPLVDVLRRHVPKAWWFAEHAAWRFTDGAWQSQHSSAELPGALLGELRRIVERTPGARLERKTAGVCVHWRQVAEPERAGLIAAVDECVAGWLVRHPAYERMPGVLMLEVRPRGVHKGIAVSYARQRLPGVPIVAIGDDVTDEDMFRALGDGDIAIAVGRHLGRRTHARVSVADVGGARRFLRWLVDARKAPRPAATVSVEECPAVAPSVAGVELLAARHARGPY